MQWFGHRRRLELRRRFDAMVKRDWDVVAMVGISFFKGDEYLRNELQHAMLMKMWRHVETLTSMDSDAWRRAVLLKMARYEAKRILRAERRHASHFVPLEAAVAESVPDDDNERRMMRMTEVLHAAIDTLSDDERELLAMYMDKTPEAEIAADMGVEPATLRKRIQRLKEKIAREYNKIDNTEHHETEL